MEFLYKMALQLLETIEGVGDWLMQPAINEQSWIYQCFETAKEGATILGHSWAVSIFDSILMAMSDSVATLLIGTGLLFILGFKLIKFFVDIVL